MVYIAYLGSMIIISLTQEEKIFLLLVEKVIVSKKYLDFIEIFSKKLVAILFKYFDIIKYIIDLELDQQTLFKLIYSLKLVELKIFKTCIKTNLVNKFI